MNIGFLKSIEKELKAVEKLMAERLQSPYGEIKPMVKHSLNKTGKMLRPALAVIFGKMAGTSFENITRIGATLEILHNSTLIHDDVIDNADTRRGQKTHNAIWDNTLTILYGDYMFANAMMLAVETGSIDVLRDISEIAKNLVSGELLQNANAYNYPPAKEKYFEIIRLKTAVLFGGCCSLPVLVSPEKDLAEKVKTFGEKLGIAFQIVDDCLDFKADIKKLGKPKLIDLPEGKATLPVLLALEEGEKTVTEIVRKVFDSKGEDFSEKDKSALAKTLREKGYIKQAFKQAKELISQCFEILDTFNDSKEKDILKQACNFVIDREF